MAEQIIDGTGSGYLVAVTSDNRMRVDISGATITIGSVSANVDSIYVQSGIINIEEQVPTNANKNNEAWKFEYISSGTAAGVTGSAIGSITQFIATGSYVSVWTYSNDNITNIGSWS